MASQYDRNGDRTAHNDNYYQSPVHDSDYEDEDEYYDDVAHDYRSTSSLALAMKIIFCIYLVSLPFGLWAYYNVWDICHSETTFPASQFMVLWKRYSFVEFIQGAVALINLILYFMWINRSNKNAAYLKGGRLSIGSVGSVAWYFVPLVNLVRTYSSMREMFQASGHRQVPEIVGFWWFFCLLAPYLYFVISFFYGAVGDLEIVRISRQEYLILPIPLIVGGYILAFLSVVAVFGLIGSLTMSQDSTFASVQRKGRAGASSAGTGQASSGSRPYVDNMHSSTAQMGNAQARAGREPGMAIPASGNSLMQGVVSNEIAPGQRSTINDRYACVDEHENWDYGHPNHCIDLKTQQACLCVRIPSPESGLQTIQQETKKIIALNIQGLIAPSSACHVKLLNDPLSVSGQPALNSNDTILIFSKGLGVSLLRYELRGAEITRPPFPHLKQLAQLLKDCHDNKIPLQDIDYEQLRVHETGGPMLLALFPFIKNLLTEKDFVEHTSRVLDPNYAGDLHPTRLLAASASIMLSPINKRQDYIAHDGQHVPIATLPAKTNGLIAKALNPRMNVQTLPSPMDFVSLMEDSFCVDFDSYLSKEQQGRLRDRQGLDESTIIKMIVRALREDGITTPLLYHQNPRPISDDELAIALGHINSAEDQQQDYEKLYKIQKIGLITASLLSVLLFVFWCLADSAGVTAIQLHSPNSGLLETAFTSNTFSKKMPSSNYKRLPGGASRLRYYVQLSNSRSNGVRVSVRLEDQDGKRLSQYGHNFDGNGGWLYCDFPTTNPQLSAITATITFNQKQVHTETIAVGSSFLASFGNVFLLIAAIWISYAAIIWKLNRDL